MKCYLHIQKMGKQNEILNKFVRISPERVTDDQFAVDLVRTFVACDIPLEKLDHPALRSFLEKYTGRTVPSVSTLRRMDPGLFDVRVQEIIKNLSGQENIGED